MIQQWHCDFSDPRDSLNAIPDIVGPFQYQKSDCYITATSSESMASTSLQYLNGFTHGELLNAFFSLLILVVVFFKVLVDRSLGVKKQNTQNYN